MSLLASAYTVLAVINPGQGTEPPGFGNANTVVSWVAWGATAACVVGFLIAGATMALSHQGHGGGQHGSRLAWVMGGCLVVGAASSLVGALA